MATCAPGFEDVLEREVRELEGVKTVLPTRGGAEFSGELDLIYRANLRLRTANRVLWRLGDFLAQSYPMLFNKAQKLPWELYLGFATQLSVQVSAKASRLSHKDNIASTLHSAVLAALKPHGQAPVLAESAPLTLHARLFRDRCSLSLDTSGDLLHRRGYRQETAKAPLRETLAAAVLLGCDWRAYDLIADPMCGSGTFPIEAALLARNIAPGQHRSFAFESFPSFQATKWQRFKREAEAKAATSVRPRLRLVAADHHPGALRALRGNAERAGVGADLEVYEEDARLLDYLRLRGACKRPLLVSNPPYGLRIGAEEEVTRLYEALGGRLRERAKGWDFAIISPHPRLLQAAGLKVRSSRPFTSGGVRVALYKGTVS
jgi:putative N6-adenine-specific DNA methylase